MSVETNKGIAQCFFAEVFNQQRHDTATEILAADFVAHHPAFLDGIGGPKCILNNPRRGVFDITAGRIFARIALGHLQGDRYASLL
jgi:hypothetical protein